VAGSVQGMRQLDDFPDGGFRRKLLTAGADTNGSLQLEAQTVNGTRDEPGGYRRDQGCDRDGPNQTIGGMPRRKPGPPEVSQGDSQNHPYEVATRYGAEGSAEPGERRSGWVAGGVGFHD